MNKNQSIIAIIKVFYSIGDKACTYVLEVGVQSLIIDRTSGNFDQCLTLFATGQLGWLRIVLRLVCGNKSSEIIKIPYSCHMLLWLKNVVNKQRSNNFIAVIFAQVIVADLFGFLLKTLILEMQIFLESKIFKS